MVAARTTPDLLVAPAPDGNGDTRDREEDAEVVATPELRYLTVMHSPGLATPTRVRLDGGAVTIGRDPAKGRVHLQVEDPAMSGLHAVVDTHPLTDRYLIANRSSRQATFVNGQYLPWARLEHGMVLRLGDTLLSHTVCRPRPIAADVVPADGESLLMAVIRRMIEVAAPTDLPILISGETGVGKEVVARLIHAESGRTGRYVPVNCSRMTGDRLDSTLFGHARGAYTGAVEATQGAMVEAAGGTLLLDEVGELSPEAQARLLRALQEGEVIPLGSTTPVRTTCRVIAATNRDLEKECKAGLFREDLYARLKKVHLQPGPLRERPEDVLPLLRKFLKTRAPLTVRAAEALLLYDYPLNIRELQDAATEIDCFGNVQGRIDLQHLPESIAAMHPTDRGNGVTSSEDVVFLLRKNEGNVNRTAKELHKQPHALRKWLKRHGIDPNDYRRR